MLIKVKNIEQLNEAAQRNEIYVVCVCPNCKDESTSFIPNARLILTKQKCVWCQDKNEITDNLKIGVLK